MEKVQHSSNNMVLGAPPGWQQDVLPCDALPVTLTEMNGLPTVVSFWKPTADELLLLCAGGSVALSIIGESMPPVSLSVEP
jgi:hypothetical protein